MTYPRLHTALAIAVLMAFTGAAQAQERVYTRDTTTVYQGPDVSYPPLAEVPENTPLDLWGCLDDRSWCDVGLEGDRGWVMGQTIERIEGSSTVYVQDTSSWIIPLAPVVLWGTYGGWRHYGYGHPGYGHPGGWRPPPGGNPTFPGHPPGHGPGHPGYPHPGQGSGRPGSWQGHGPGFGHGAGWGQGPRPGTGPHGPPGGTGAPSPGGHPGGAGHPGGGAPHNGGGGHPGQGGHNDGH
jgi:uncharacterized protein YraI